MRFLLLLLCAGAMFAASWDKVQAIPAAHKIQVQTKNGTTVKATFVSASADSMVVREASGERSIARADIAAVRVYSAGRRIRRGVLWTVIGAAIGAGIGEAVCPYCSNEGHGAKYVGPGAGAGAAIGALGFLSSPYKTVYKGK